MNVQQPKNFSNHWLQLLTPNLPSNLQSNLSSSNSKIPECDFETMSKESQGFTQINGSTPPGTLALTQNGKVLLDIVNAQGQRVLMIKSIRKAGTRIGIHIHRYGGYTLILKGVMTDFVEGQPNKKYGPNSGYYMPPCTPMSAANLGSQDVELIDIFIGPPGQPYIEILEPDWTFKRINRWK